MGISSQNKWTKALKRRIFSAWPQKEWQEGGLRHWTTNEKKNTFDVNVIKGSKIHFHRKYNSDNIPWFGHTFILQIGYSKRICTLFGIKCSKNNSICSVWLLLLSYLKEKQMYFYQIETYSISLNIENFTILLYVQIDPFIRECAKKYAEYF